MKVVVGIALLLASLSLATGAAHGRALAPRPFSTVSPGLRRTRACPLPLKAAEGDVTEPADAAPTEPASAPAAAAPAAEQPAAPPEPPKPICSTCDGSGRIEGGWGTLPGLKWVSTTFGLRAYRPCSECARAGRRYVRVGQNLEEIYSGAPRRMPKKPQ